MAQDSRIEDLCKALNSTAPLAVETLRDGLEGQLGGSANDHLRLKAAESVLDRAGYGRQTKVDSRVMHGHFTAQDLADMRQRALDAIADTDKEMPQIGNDSET